MCERQVISQGFCAKNSLSWVLLYVYLSLCYLNINLHARPLLVLLLKTTGQGINGCQFMYVNHREIRSGGPKRSHMEYDCWTHLEFKHHSIILISLVPFSSILFTHHFEFSVLCYQLWFLTKPSLVLIIYYYCIGSIGLCQIFSSFPFTSIICHFRVIMLLAPGRGTNPSC